MNIFYKIINLFVPIKVGDKVNLHLEDGIVNTTMSGYSIAYEDNIPKLYAILKDESDGGDLLINYFEMNKEVKCFANN